MAYDLVRWCAGAVVFAAVFAVLALITKKKGKSALISAFVAVIFSAVMLLVPIENVFFGFSTVEKAYSYKHHEDLLAYAECDEGAVCVGSRKGENDVFYFLNKDSDGYKIPRNSDSKITIRSSKFGIYAFKKFENCTVIITQVDGSAYDGKNFSVCSGNYYNYTVVEGAVDFSKLTCNGEKLSLA